MGALKVAVMTELTDTLEPTGLLIDTVGAVSPDLASVLPPPPQPTIFNTTKINKVEPLKEELRNILDIP